MSAFDTVLMVDWSAAKAKSGRPQKDAIWIGISENGQDATPVYCPSRIEAEKWLTDRLDAEKSKGRRVLVGFDFPFGYPAGFARIVTGSDDPFDLWDWLEAEIIDTESGDNNRYDVAETINALFEQPGPFWGKHDKAKNTGVPYKKESVRFVGIDEKRQTDRVAKASSSVFQLAFPPTVGGQVLTGLPVLARLRRNVGARVWPLEDTHDAQIVLAEIWPGLIEKAVQTAGGEIRDSAQVRLLARAFAGLSADQLVEMMAVPEIAKEEAWILGAGHETTLLNKALGQLTPPRLKNDCFALPPGVDWTPVDEALARLEKALSPVVASEVVSVDQSAGRVLVEPVRAARSNPPAANSAVDGYGFAFAAIGTGDQTLPLIDGRAAAGAPFQGTVPAGSAIRILTGAVLPQGVDTVVLEEDTSTDGTAVAFVGDLKPFANTREAGEDVKVGASLFNAGQRLGPAEVALLSATGVTEVPVYRPLRVGVLSTGTELVASGSDPDPTLTYDANRPMLLSLLEDWRMTPVDLGHVPDDRAALGAVLDDAASRVDAILTSGGASAGDEDHVSALLKDTGSLADWRIALKPGRPLALGVWSGVPVFGLPGNPVAALVCTMIFARPAFALLGGEGWQRPVGFEVPAAFEKNKKPGRREFLRARLNSDGAAEVFKSEGSGRVSGLAWADGLVEIGDGARDIRLGDPVRYIPYASFR